MGCTLTAVGKYTTCCLLGCKFIPGHDGLVVSATDGYVVFYPIPSVSLYSINIEWTFTSRFQIHQSSIKCMDFSQVSGIQKSESSLMVESEVEIVTGGDDNAIHLTKIMMGETITWESIATILDSHTSTVMGVLSLGNLKFLSVGIDQKIRIWKITGVHIIHLYEDYTVISDVGGFIEIDIQENKRQFVIFGTGMELLQLDKSILDSVE
jgi:WD40 repeat protein